MNRSLRLVFLALFVLLATVACEGDRTVENNTFTGPDPDATITVQVGGSVRGLTGGFQAKDTSKCFEGSTEVNCTTVFWDAVEQTTGVALEGQPGTVGGTFTFTGVPAGTYTVTQTVSYGSSKKSRDHTNIVVQ